MDPKPTTVIVHFYAKPDQVEALRKFIVPAMPRLSGLFGCLGGSLYHDVEEPELFVLVEHWKSVERHQQYVAQLEEDGTMERMRPMLAREPERRYLKQHVA